MTLTIAPTLSDLLPAKLDGLADAIRTQTGRKGLSIGWPFVENQALSGLRSTLSGVDLCEQLAQAWVTIEALRAYKSMPPSETAIVPLGRHTLDLTATPVLKLKVGGLTLPDLKLTYAITAAFERATLSIRDGALVAVAPGQCEFTVALSCGKVPLHPPWKLAEVPLPPARDFSPGWKLP